MYISAKKLFDISNHELCAKIKQVSMPDEEFLDYYGHQFTCRSGKPVDVETTKW